MSNDVEEKNLSMYAKGMTTRDIEIHIQDIYGLEVSDAGLIDGGDVFVVILKRVNDIAADSHVLTILHHYVEFTQNLTYPQKLSSLL